MAGVIGARGAKRARRRPSRRRRNSTGLLMERIRRLEGFLRGQYGSQS